MRYGWMNLWFPSKCLGKQEVVDLLYDCNMYSVNAITVVCSSVDERPQAGFPNLLATVLQ